MFFLIFSDLVGNPEDRFSHNEAHMSYFLRTGTFSWNFGVSSVNYSDSEQEICELGQAIIQHFSRGNQRSMGVIPVTDCLRKEITFIIF